MPKRYLNPDTYANASVIVCPSIANLRLQPVPTYVGNTVYGGDALFALAILAGSASAFDGTAAVYAWDASSGAADNGTTVIAPGSPQVGGNPGRWRRLGSTL